MKINRYMMAVAVAAGVGALEARTFEVAAWRGETVAARVADFAELGEAPKGLTVKTGVLKSVRYTNKPEGLQLLETYDRVVWGRNGKGPRVVEIAVPADAKPGVYACGNMNIRVIDRVLPPAKEWKYVLDLWQHPWAVARVAKAKPFSRKHYAAMRPVYELLATAGQKMITATLLDEPWDHQCCDAYGSMIGRVKRADGSWSFDYAVFDEYVEFCRSCGLGPDIACYTMCPWGYVVRWQDEKGATQSCVAKPGTPEFADYWGAFLVDFAKHLKEKGWLDRTYIAMDERSPEDVRLIATFIQEKVPGLRISMAGNRKPSDFKGITIDAYSQVLFADCLTPEFLREAAERRTKGLVTTFYVCCSPTYPNTFMSSGAGEAFWLGAYPAMCGLDGFLRWAWNSWPQDPCEDASFGTWMPGDTFLCYPGGEPSWRFLELRNGIAASEKVRLLKEQGLFADEIAKVAALYKVDEAVANKCDFVWIRQETQKLVNRD